MGGAKGRGVPIKSTHCREFVVEDTSNITASELTTTLSDRERRALPASVDSWVATLGSFSSMEPLSSSSSSCSSCSGHRPFVYSQTDPGKGVGDGPTNQPDSLSLHQGRPRQDLKLLAKIRIAACDHRHSSWVQQIRMSEVATSVSPSEIHGTLGRGRYILQCLRHDQNFFSILRFHFHNNLRS